MRRSTCIRAANSTQASAQAAQPWRRAPRPSQGHAEQQYPPAGDRGRLIPGHWDGDLIKGEGHRSSVGTLVERTTRFVILAKMDNAGTPHSGRELLGRAKPPAGGMRKSMTYDHGREMHGHNILTERTGVQISFADPHSSWQRGRTRI